jgi:hypothetical protein
LARCLTIGVHAGRSKRPVEQSAADNGPEDGDRGGVTPSPNLEPGLVRESSCPGWGLKGFSDGEATQCRADRVHLLDMIDVGVIDEMEATSTSCADPTGRESTSTGRSFIPACRQKEIGRDRSHRASSTGIPSSSV